MHSGDEGGGAIDELSALRGGGHGGDEGVDEVEVEDCVVGTEGERRGGVNCGGDGGAVAWGAGG